MYKERGMCIFTFAGRYGDGGGKVSAQEGASAVLALLAVGPGYEDPGAPLRRGAAKGWPVALARRLRCAHDEVATIVRRHQAHGARARAHQPAALACTLYTSHVHVDVRLDHCYTRTHTCYTATVQNVTRTRRDEKRGSAWGLFTRKAATWKVYMYAAELWNTSFDRISHTGSSHFRATVAGMSGGSAGL